MNDKHRQAYALHEMGFSFAHIARQLGCSRPRAYQLLSEARWHIKRHSLYERTKHSVTLANLRAITLAFYSLDPSKYERSRA